MTDLKITGKKNIWVLIPLGGGLLFIFTYIMATLLYPGGSPPDITSKGFSWLHNYWCNLLNEKAMNGEYNSAKPVAIAGMFILCFSLAYFWYQFAELVKFPRKSQKIMQFSGIISMCAALLLFTSYHDIIINIAGLLAIFPLAGTLTGLYKMGWRKLFWFGLLNLAFIAINNYIYYTTQLWNYLPVIQKITFLCFLVWIGLIDIGLYQLSNQKENSIK